MSKHRGRRRISPGVAKSPKAKKPHARPIMQAVKKGKKPLRTSKPNP